MRSALLAYLNHAKLLDSFFDFPSRNHYLQTFLRGKIHKSLYNQNELHLTPFIEVNYDPFVSKH